MVHYNDSDKCHLCYDLNLDLDHIYISFLSFPFVSVTFDNCQKYIHVFFHSLLIWKFPLSVE